MASIAYPHRNHRYLPLLQVIALHPSSQTKYPTSVCLSVSTPLHHLHTHTHTVKSSVVVNHILIIGSRAYIGNTLRGKNGLHAFGYNSAESEPIRMKSGTVWAKCGGLALADFGRDPCSSDSLRGIVPPPKKNEKKLTKFPGLATSGRHNSAMITDRRKCTSTWSLHGMSSFHFYRYNQFKVFLWSVRSVQERYLPKFSATSHVR